MQQNFVSPVFMIVWLVFIVLYIVAMWRIYAKADKPGWAAVIPFYNLYVLLQIVGRPAWWIVLLLVPVVNLVISFIVAIDLARVFGRSNIFGVVALWLFSFVGYLMLAFGKAKYVGPANSAPAPQPSAQQVQPITVQANTPQPQQPQAQ